MDIHKFAYTLLDQCEELEALRMENARLREQVSEYMEFVNNSNRQYEKGFADIITNCLEQKK